MKRPQLGRGRKPEAQANERTTPVEVEKEESATMAVADPTTQAPVEKTAEEIEAEKAAAKAKRAAQAAERKAKIASGEIEERPKIQTTVTKDLNAAFEAFCAERKLAPNVALRVILAEQLNVTLPGSELKAVTRTKYATPEEAKAAKAEKAKEHNAELKAAMEFYRQARARGEV